MRVITGEDIIRARMKVWGHPGPHDFEDALLASVDLTPEVIREWLEARVSVDWCSCLASGKSHPLGTIACAACDKPVFWKLDPKLFCDKCGDFVPNDNNALELETLIAERSPKKGLDNIPSLDFVNTQRRHLRPTGECPGSPSCWRRVLDGEDLWKQAYDEMQRAYGDKTPIPLPPPEVPNGQC